ncbi:MAG: Tex family protein [Desulforhopalus sp.]
MTCEKYSPLIARELQLPIPNVTGTLSLLAEGGTVPFIARYRKELTGSLDEVAIGDIRKLHDKFLELDKRRETILGLLAQNGLLTNSLEKKLQEAKSLQVLEDIYLPFRPKRKTRASMARERGLEPLAEMIMLGQPATPDLTAFINPEKDVQSAQDALAGARDIIAEDIAEDPSTRAELRQVFTKCAVITSTVIKKMAAQGEKFKDYFDWQEPASKAPAHRLLALFRGAREKILTVSIRPPQETCLRLLKKRYLKSGPWREEINAAIEDGYQRLLAPSLESELTRSLKDNADEESIHIFSENLRQLLLAPPLGRKRVLALDPGYRTGAKLVCLDEQGNLLHTATIYPTHGGKKADEAAATVKKLAALYTIEAIAVGNGTAGRETERFIRSLALNSSIIITLINEDGASIYSASASARKEFPDHDITVRGAVSIGRRLQDPLAELVKIDPKSIGVGQYQHDVNQTSLKKSLEEVVESCVNAVGVELNTASSELLTYVAGLGPVLADNIVRYREDTGPFRTRRELLKVSRLGPKAFEQCAGFLRIADSANPLDATGVHPERYPLVERMAADASVTVEAFLQSPEIRSGVNLENYVDNAAGMPTLIDIMEEIAKPGRDPRKRFEQFQFVDTVHSIEDLHEGMMLPAIITNITKFGAFADIGIKRDGLIHISEMADRFVNDPGEIVKLGQQVEVRVLEIDRTRNRIALSMRMI